MSDWPASAEQIAKDSSTAPTEIGVGPFVLVTRAWVNEPGNIHAFRCTHRFSTMAGRADFREMAERFGIFESERTE